MGRVKMILVHLTAILSLLIVVHGRLSWKQEPFDDNLPFEENFANWNVLRFSWGIKEGLVDIKNNTLQVFYPNGSHTPRGKIRGGFGFNSAPLNLEFATTVTLEYEVMFESGFEFVKGGKLPGLFGGSENCAGGA